MSEGWKTKTPVTGVYHKPDMFGEGEEGFYADIYCREGMFRTLAYRKQHDLKKCLKRLAHYSLLDKSALNRMIKGLPNKKEEDEMIAALARNKEEKLDLKYEEEEDEEDEEE